MIDQITLINDFTFYWVFFVVFVVHTLSSILFSVTLQNFYVDQLMKIEIHQLHLVITENRCVEVQVENACVQITTN